MGAELHGGGRRVERVLADQQEGVAGSVIGKVAGVITADLRGEQALAYDGARPVDFGAQRAGPFRPAHQVVACRRIDGHVGNVGAGRRFERIAADRGGIEADADEGHGCAGPSEPGVPDAELVG